MVSPQPLIIDIGLGNIRSRQHKHRADIRIDDLCRRPQSSFFHYRAELDLLAFEFLVDIVDQNSEVRVRLTRSLIEITLSNEIKTIC